jgi:hypothetical protein
VRLVSVEAASAHVRRDTVDDDDDFAIKIEAASEMVLDYIGSAADPWTDSAGQPFEDSNGEAMDVPKRVQAATLIMVGYLYRERDASNENQVPAQWGYGYLPVGVTALLYSLRKPTVA